MPKDRKEQIKDILTEKPFVSLHELEAKFPEVTSMTLRRDIAYLESRGELIKVRGGARSMKFITSSMEDEFGKRLHECTEEKARIALAALAFIEPNRSIFIDSGTTALALASVVPDQHIIFTTTGPHVAIELAKNRKNIVNLVGGMINHDNFSVSGMEALRFVSEINIDIAFMVPSCVSVSCGFTCGNYSECEMKKFILAKAMRKIVLMDSTKLGKSLPYTFCHAEDIDVLITDDELPHDFRDQLEKNNVKIIIAK